MTIRSSAADGDAIPLKEHKNLVRGLRQQLVDKLRNDVLTGFYKAGDSIRQEEVVARYGVSRTPVREALIQLEQEGLVVNVPHCGAKVAPLASDTIQGLWIPIRRIIEIYALRLCFASLNEDDFRKWEGILEQMQRACQQRDYVSLAELDVAFHRALIERAGEPSLLRVWTPLTGQLRNYFLRSHAAYADLMDVYREHAAILATFRGGDRDVAVAFLAQRIGDPQSEKIFEDMLILQGAVRHTRPA